MVLNGTIGARLHIAFPVLNRSSFGFWLSYFTVISRVVLSMFWFGIQVSLSECSRKTLLKYINVVFHWLRSRLPNVESNMAFDCKITQSIASIV